MRVFNNLELALCICEELGLTLTVARKTNNYVISDKQTIIATYDSAKDIIHDYGWQTDFYNAYKRQFTNRYGIKIFGGLYVG